MRKIFVLVELAVLIFTHIGCKPNKHPPAEEFHKPEEVAPLQELESKKIGNEKLEKEELTLEQGVRLEKVTEWIYEKDIVFIAALVDNQVFCREYVLIRSYSEGIKTYAIKNYIINYLSGETTYSFDDIVNLWGLEFERKKRMFIYDQYGKYLFLEKKKDMIVFDAEEKRGIIPGEILKRHEYVYYTESRLTGEYQFVNGKQRPIGAYYLIKHNVSSGQETVTSVENTISDSVLYDTFMYSHKTLIDIGNNQLRLDSDRLINIVQLDESMTRVLGITRKEMEYNPSIRFFVPIDCDNYIGFTETQDDIYLGSEVPKYYVQLLDENGKITKAYKDIRTEQDDSPWGGIYDSKSIRARCLVSPDKQYVLFFSYFSDHVKASVYQIIY